MDGGPYWVTARLLDAAASSWRAFNGWAVARRIDPLDLPLHSYLDLVYFWLTDGGTADQIEQFDHDLRMPPPDATDADFERQPEWAPEEVGASFLAALAAGVPR